MRPASRDAGGSDSGHLSGYSINPFGEPTFTSVPASNCAYGSADPQKCRESDSEARGSERDGNADNQDNHHNACAHRWARPRLRAPVNGRRDTNQPLVMKTAGQGSVTNVRPRQHAWHNDGLIAGTIIGGLALGTMAAATAPQYDSGIRLQAVCRHLWLSTVRSRLLPVPALRLWCTLLVSRLELSMVPLPVALIKITDRAFVRLMG